MNATDFVVVKRPRGVADIAVLIGAAGWFRSIVLDHRTLVAYRPLGGPERDSLEPVVKGSDGWALRAEGPWGVVPSDRHTALATAERDDVCVVFVGRDGGVAGYRPVSGRVPLHVHATSEATIVATSVRGLLATGLVAPEPDPVTTALLRSHVWIAPDGHGLVAGTQTLSRGTQVVVGRPGRSPMVRQVWDPSGLVPGAPDARRARSHARQLRERLLTVLDSQTQAAGHHMLMMSGGLDSTVLATLLHRELGRTVDSWSMLPSDGPEVPKVRAHIDRAARLGAIRRRHEVSLPVTRRIPTPSRLGQSPVPMPGPLLARLAQDVDGHHTVIGGEFADDVCGGRIAFPDWAGSTSALRLLKQVGRWPGGATDVVRWRRWRNHQSDRRLPYTVRATGDEHLDTVLAEFLEGERRRLDPWSSSPRRWLHAHARSDLWLALYWEVLADRNAVRITPFTDKAILELGYASHPHDLMGPTHKRLLREAMRGLVPDEVLDDRWRGHWIPDRWRLLPRSPRVMAGDKRDLMEEARTAMIHACPSRATSGSPYEEQ